MAALSAEPALAAVSGARIKAIAFDGLAIFDVRPVATLAETIFPGRGDEMSVLWRTRQFEYTPDGVGKDLNDLAAFVQIRR